jgi:hypothetical protein
MTCWKINRNKKSYFFLLNGDENWKSIPKPAIYSIHSYLRAYSRNVGKVHVAQ